MTLRSVRAVGGVALALALAACTPSSPAPDPSPSTPPVTSAPSPSPSTPPVTSAPSPTPTTDPSPDTADPLLPGDPCDPAAGSPDCTDATGMDGSGYRYVEGYADCVARFGADEAYGLCTDLDGDGRAGYPDSG
ncbi:hypothetical protein [Cellulomonas humilata]|uniref:Kazal-like domain-containing protein n=1 Tax=Cellulomonas humilata TaxID=144055 RepID=A0ABU0EJ70_9CELL|nr:hypothetical protein [Cellulomonas humilata]MDQ0375335.1 hypothetical protein [Cellulomonas humilata]